MKVGYIYEAHLASLADESTPPCGRSSRVHALIRASGYLEDPSGALQQCKVQPELNTAKILAPQPASYQDLLRSHSAPFLNAALRRPDPKKAESTSSGSSDCDSSDSEGSSGSTDSESERPRKRRRKRSIVDFGLSADHPPSEYFTAVAGSSLSAAEHLCAPASAQSDLEPADKVPDDVYDIVINWEGGRHHAMRDKAAGFCYVQDVGLAIDLLRRKGCVRYQAVHSPSDTVRYISQTSQRRPRILYLDLDIHYGDGVAAACRHPYRYSYPATKQQLRHPKPTILTLSLHHHARGFYPANPEGDLTPSDTPSPFNLSIPLQAGASARTYSRLMRTCVEPIKSAFDPDYVVLLLGMDALHGDELVDGAGNWSLAGEGGVAWTCARIRDWKLRTLVLGGGGYHRLNTARGWACATGIFLVRNVEPDTAVPEHKFWPEYGPSFSMDVEAGNVKDLNTEGHLVQIEDTSRVWVERITEIMR